MTLHKGELKLTHGEIRRDLSCDSLQVAGETTIDGDFRAKRVDVQGKLVATGKSDIGTLDANGEVILKGEAEIENIDTEGRTWITGKLVADVAKFDGSLRVSPPSECDEGSEEMKSKTGASIRINEAEAFGEASFAEGEFDSLLCSGSLQVEQIDTEQLEFEITSPSQIDVLECVDARITTRGMSESPRVVCGRITAETVDLDSVDAGVVICEEAILGPDVRIDKLVIPTDDFEKHPDARIGEILISSDDTASD